MTPFKETVLPILRSTRDMSFPNWGIAEEKSRKTSSVWDVVTKIDEDIERHLRTELEKAYPEIGFVGEEEGGDRTMDRYWLVDPIDGTVHFIRGLSFCTTMIALVEHGEVIFSAIYDFINDDIYHADKGKGAYKNDVAIHVSDKSFGESYVCYESDLTKGSNLELFMSVGEKTQLVNWHAAGYEFIQVATGKVEARVNVDPWGKDYDFAPGTLLVKEAGGIVTNIGSNSYDLSNTNLIAANPIIYSALTEGEDALFPIGMVRT